MTDFRMKRPMIDRNVSLLLDQLQFATGNYLIVADENWAMVNWRDIRRRYSCNLTVVSNRYDLAQQAISAQIETTFNDLDFNHLETNSFDGILFRVSKERASSHHVINKAVGLLKPKSSLMLSGSKNDGIKTYVKKTCDLFGMRSAAKKIGAQYIASISLYCDDLASLDENNYSSIQSVKALSQISLVTKPGVFGWNKIDRGSAFFVEHLPLFISNFSQRPRTMLDLGCGYGYLSSQAKFFGIEQLTATDNNAAAILVALENLKCIVQDVQVIASNAGDVISQQFDTIWCNPPFHQGFTIDGDLSSKFLASTKRLLKPQGYAMFVVNSFIPLEQKAKEYFRSIEVVASNRSFKLVALGNQQNNNNQQITK